MSPRPHRELALLSIIVVAAACGGGGGDHDATAPGLAAVSTLAYVVSECRVDAEALTIHQSLQVRQGEGVPITVAEREAVLPPDEVFANRCETVGRFRQGPLFAELGVFRRLGVTPDGTQVVFEVTDEVREWVVFPPLFPLDALPAEQKGIFVVGSDGSGLRRLGPASRAHSFYLSFFAFSPSGRLVAYTDYGPGPNDVRAVQIITLDVLTGERRQVTRLPPASGSFGGTYQPFFNDEQTITFNTRANADGNHPSFDRIVVTINADGTGLRVAPPVVAIPGSETLTSFRITGADLDAAVLFLPGTPKNPGINGNHSIQEVFDIDRENNILQLTNFERTDTFNPAVTGDEQRVLFSASADPLGTNPTEECQVFSTDRNGGDMRQLTYFHDVPEGRRSTRGCSFGERSAGCLAVFVNRDVRTDAMIFYSNCDAFGTNPNGGQLFAMHADGTALRQLTTTRGYERDPSGTFTVEHVFPFAWPGYQINNQQP